jgi:succinyl-CoA synthetase beta subunit
MTLVTKQTGAAGKLVRKVLVEESIYYPNAEGKIDVAEYYMSILLNRATGRNIVMYSPKGGMNIEEVAEQTPELIYKEEINPATGLLPFQAGRIAFNLGLSGDAMKNMKKFVSALVNAYLKSDSSMMEINPVFKTSDGKILAADCKVKLDDNALFRQKEFAAMRDITEEAPAEDTQPAEEAPAEDETEEVAPSEEPAPSEAPAPDSSTSAADTGNRSTTSIAIVSLSALAAAAAASRKRK